MARHRRLRGWIEPVQYWTISAAVVVWVMVLIAWRERPPAPKPATVAPTEFSAARAWPVLSMLADSIRYRVAGTPGADSAAAYLERTLRAIPGIEVAQQDASGAWSAPRYGTVAYTVRNVLVRIPGRSRDAVLLSAHYDSPAGSVGAADDGVAVASLVEVVRALAAGPTLAHTVIVNFNDGEEQGLAGAHGFTQHPWIRDVRAFVNLESAGTSGKAILFQTGPGNAWLTDAYARAVPYPYGTVIAQDIFQSGAIPSDTDFRIYRDFASLPGLDIALYRGGWAYHTQRDRTWNIKPGSMQQMGANALALARTLANGPLPGNVSRVRAVYYDLLGVAMVHYTERTAVLLAGLAVVLGLAVLALAVRRERFRVRELALALVFAVATVVAMLAGALAVAWVVAYPLGHPMSWFAHPGAGLLAFATAGLALALVLHRWLARTLDRRGTPAPARATAAQGGTLLFWMLVLVLLTWAGLGVAYVGLWWVVGSAVGLALTVQARDSRWWIGALVGALPAAVLTLHLLITLTALFVPVFGRLPLPFAPDLVLAVMVAVPASGIVLALLPGAHRAGALGAMAVAMGALTVGALATSVVQPRYTFLRPQRLTIEHRQVDATGVLRVIGSDYDTPRAALARAGGFHATMSGPRPLVFERPAGPTGFDAPRAELLASTTDSARGTRTLTIRFTAPGASRFRVLLPRTRIAGWSLPAPILPPSETGPELRVAYVAPPDTGWRVSLEVRGAEPLPIELYAVRPHTTPDAATLLRELPTWTDAHVLTVNRGDWRF